MSEGTKRKWEWLKNDPWRVLIPLLFALPALGLVGTLLGDLPLWTTALSGGALLLVTTVCAAFFFSPKAVQLLFAIWGLGLIGLFAFLGDASLAQEDRNERSIARLALNNDLENLRQAQSENLRRQELASEVEETWQNPLPEQALEDFSIDYAGLGECSSACMAGVSDLELDSHWLPFSAILADEYRSPSSDPIDRAVDRYRKYLSELVTPVILDSYQQQIAALPADEQVDSTEVATQQGATDEIQSEVKDLVDEIRIEVSPARLATPEVGCLNEATTKESSITELEHCRLEVTTKLAAELETIRYARTMSLGEFAAGSAEQSQANLLLGLTEKDLDLARTELAALRESASSSKDPQYSVWERIGSGANRISTAVLKPANSSVVAGAATWALFAVLGFALFRTLVAVSARRQTGPVTVQEFIDESTGDSSAAYSARIRAHLAKAQIGEPGTLPGSESAASLASLATAVDSKTGGIAALFAGLPPLLLGKRGFEALGSANAVKGSTTIVRIQLRRIGSGKIVYADKFESDDTDEAFRSAASAIAAAVLNRSYRLAGWALWTGDRRGEGLNHYLRAQQSTLDPATERSHLKTALSHAPGSGLAAVALSHNHMGEGEILKGAIEAARAVGNNPRFLVARYRLAAALSMAAGDTKANVAGTGRALERAELQRLLPKLEITKEGLSSDQIEAELLEQAIVHAEHVKGKANGRIQIWLHATFFPRERSAWLDLRRRPDRPGKTLATSAAGIVKIIELRRTKAGDITPDPNGDPYNEACRLSIALELGLSKNRAQTITDIIGQLNAALTSADVPPPSLSWIRSDPDLKPVRHESQFRQWLAEQEPKQSKPEVSP